jgi:GDPmannose 4,6-dehydratase
MHTALISGITGQDGRYLARNLARRGYRVVGTTRGDPNRAQALLESFVGAAVAVVELDLLNCGAVATCIGEVKPDEIYHLAGQTSVARSLTAPLDTWHANATTTLHLLEAVRCECKESRLLAATSGEIFGDTLGERAHEGTRLSPRSPYAASKAATHHLVSAYRASYGLFACSAILYNHESPLRPPTFFTKKVVRGAVEVSLGLREQLELGAVDVERDFGSADEYMDAARLMLQLPAPEDFVLASGHSHTLRRFVELAFAAVGRDYRDHVKFDATLLRSCEIRAMHADPSKAQRTLGWRSSTAFEDLVRGLVAAEREHLAEGSGPRE